MTQRFDMVRTFSRIAFALALLLPGAPALAADHTIDVEVKAPFEPESAHGLVITHGKTTEKPNPPFHKTGQDTYIVSVPYSDADVGEDTFASAMLFSPERDFALGNVKLLSQPGPSAPISEIPECKGSDRSKLPPVGVEQIPLLENLVTTRAKRRETMQARLKTFSELKMDVNGKPLSFFERLQKLEEGFGLSTSPALSPELPPAELNDRLRRILVTIENFDVAKRGQSKPSAADASQAAAAKR